MRDLLVTAIVLGAIPFAVRHAWIGVLLWTWLSIMNPHRLTWGFAYDAPFAALAAGATLLGLVFGKDTVRLPNRAVVYLLVMFLLWMLLTSIFAIFPGESIAEFERIAKIQVMTLIALAVLREKNHILLFVGVNAFSIAFFGIKGGIYTIETGGGGRVWGPGGFIGGNNEVGLAILIAIPLVYFLCLIAENRWFRRGGYIVILICAIAVLGTQSRGAFLAIVAMSFVLWLRAPGKLAIGIAIAIAASTFLAFMPETWHDRMSTIQTYEEDGSAMGRIEAWGMAFALANDRFLGGGFAVYDASVYAIYQPTAAAVRAAHSIYFQVLGEHGWVGLMLFLLIWAFTWREAARIRGMAKGRVEFAWVYHLAGMCQVALIGYAVGGAFLSLAYFDYPYNLVVIVAVTRRWLDRQLDTGSALAAGTAGPNRLPATAPGRSEVRV